MNKEDVKNKTTEELSEELKTLRKAQFENNVNLMQGKEKNVKKSKFLRKQVAIIKTILSGRLLKNG